MAKDRQAYANGARERQQRWRKRRQAEGMRSLTVMVSAEAKRVLDQERERSGETLAQVVERAALSLSCGKAGNDPLPVKVRSDGRTLTVAVSLSDLPTPSPRMDASGTKRLSADTLLKRLISKKENR